MYSKSVSKTLVSRKANSVTQIDDYIMHGPPLFNRTIQIWQRTRHHNRDREPDTTTVTENQTPQLWQRTRHHNRDREPDTTTVTENQTPQPWQRTRHHNRDREPDTTTVVNLLTSILVSHQLCHSFSSPLIPKVAGSLLCIAPLPFSDDSVDHLSL